MVVTNVPRLTAALDAFSSVTPTYNGTRTSEDWAEKWRQRAKRQTAQEFSWSKLAKAVEEEVSGKQAGQVLRQLLHASKSILGSDASSGDVEEGAVLLFKVFQDSEQLLQKHVNTLQGFFGPIPHSAAADAQRAVASVRSLLSEDVLKQIAASATAVPNEEFGKNIKFNFPSAADEEDVSFLESEEEEEEERSGFDMRYTAMANGEKLRRVKSRLPETEGIDSGWLLMQMGKYFGDEDNMLGLSIQDLTSTVFDLLCQPRSDSELQNELFELLGFDRFELIETLLGRRQEIIGMTRQRKPLPPSALLKGDAVRPQYGCQVTVLTEDEKRIQKLIRKDEKKLTRRKDGDIAFNDEKSLNLNSAELRAKREAALMSSVSAPLFSANGSASAFQQEQYPFVFDSNALARQTSAFIATTKVCLPTGFERETNNKFEEVNIPPNEQPPVDVGAKLIAVSDMDELGQIAFRNTKHLNRIQSVVYEAAYKSNENLLICAPTGAGKTNIAMLTVLRELKQHFQDGVIKKDEFKIVYVAPMKALAAEMVRNFGQRLEPLGITVMELTGDMQLTKAEIAKTQMLVTTPEKWDVVTRKSAGDVALSQIVRLLILDEVHLLHEDRGAVIESLVARTLRQVETSQTMIRILGLSATLPNYVDVARFLRVNPYKGLFYFDGRFRPVPLAQTFIGIKTTNRMIQMQDFNSVCYDRVYQQVRNKHQVMVFVHARNETVRTAAVLCEMAKNNGHIMSFLPEKSPKMAEAMKAFGKSHNKQLRELFPDGFACHHAGMLRSDRNLVEKYFADGLIKCIVCTATLAWGVNLPAHAVIIKGTQIYDAKKGSFVDLGILDVMQIFGRAGRPQYDTYGHGTIITTYDKLSLYLNLLTQSNPIESQFKVGLSDNLNAEIALGTVASVEEAVKWLSYTYLYVRMRCNPLVYGIEYRELQDDPSLENYRKRLIEEAAELLDKIKMIRFDKSNGTLHSTDLGRTASHYYIKYDTIETFGDLFKPVMIEDKVLEMVSRAQEFEQIKVRDEELTELDRHLHESCRVQAFGGSENIHGKVNILLQAYISRTGLESFSLVSDQAYIVQNASRIVRALFEMALRRNWPLMAGRLLQLSKVIEKRLWNFENPLRQFPLPFEILSKLEDRGLSVDKLKDMNAKDIGLMIHNQRMGPEVKKYVHQIPALNVSASIQPITRTVLRVVLTIEADFKWNDRIHGKTAEPFWIWIEDPDNNHIYHSEYHLVHKKHVVLEQPQSLVFTIPIFEPLPSQYLVRVISDRWLGSDLTFPISFQHLILPEKHPPHTELLDLQPLPVTALNDPELESLYGFTHFNPIQTQIFHVLYHSDGNVLLGAPTGSGKTIAAELAIFRVFRQHPGMKAVYIAPLKALVRERMEDWKVRFEERLGRKVVELTGDVAPDMRAVAKADLIVTTPEKWDGISRSWQTRNYVKAVALVVIDEIHLLGDDRGPVLEVIVSRTNFISSHTERQVRVVGLSTALANARDLADWLGIKQTGLYNFRPSVRPVPLEVHIHGFPGKHYCPRMATMNKPTFEAVRQHSPEKPVLVFVSSRRQTRLTALDLIAYLAADDNPKQWLHLPETEMESIIAGVKESNLKLTLAFGIGLHHAGLHERDRKTVEELFVNQKIQILIATSTLAWGVNFPAHLVVIKGTEYFDGKTKRYVDFPITDVLQMMGRAGRPQFDNQGKAVIFVHDVKKHFYKKFLYEPFPVESNLLEVLSDHLNAEIVAGTISSKQDAMDYITWTYFFRRLVMNPSYYKLGETTHDQINVYLSQLVQKSLQDLISSSCVEIGDDDISLSPTTGGRIASYYYISHLTLRHFRSVLKSEASISDLIKVIADANEFSTLPVRHNEDLVNAELAKKLPIAVSQQAMDSSNTKTHLLLQAHFSRQTLPSSDYLTDTKSVLDQTMRVMQALLDVSGDQGWLVTTLNVIVLMQMVVQGFWSHKNPLLILPNIQPQDLHLFRFTPPRHSAAKEAEGSKHAIECLPELVEVVGGSYQALERMLKERFTRVEIEQVLQVLNLLPVIKISVGIRWSQDEGRNREANVAIDHRGKSRRDIDYVKVLADEEYVLTVQLTRANRVARKDNRAYTTRFQKPKDEGWILVLGDIETKEVLALKRIGYVKHRTNAQLAFYAPNRPGRVIYTLYVMSDSYVGFDQQFDLFLDVAKPIPAAAALPDTVGEDVPCDDDAALNDW